MSPSIEDAVNEVELGGASTSKSHSFAQPFPSWRQRRRRTKFSPSVLKKFETVFQRNNYPGISDRDALAAETGIPEDRIQVWFQNRRRRVSKESHTEPCLKPTERRPSEFIGIKRLHEDKVRSVSKFEVVPPSVNSTTEAARQCEKKSRREAPAAECPRNRSGSFPQIHKTPAFGTILSSIPYTYACPQGAVMLPMLPPIPDILSPVFCTSRAVPVHQIPTPSHITGGYVQHPLTLHNSRSTQTKTSEELNNLLGLLSCQIRRGENRVARGLFKSFPSLRRQVPTTSMLGQYLSQSLDDSLESRDRLASPAVSFISGVHPIDSADDSAEESCDEEEYIDVCN